MAANPSQQQPADDIEGAELFPGPRRTLYIVRHGKYEQVPFDEDDPDDPEGPLDAIGREQATRLAERLRGLPVSLIHCSTLQRALDTAGVIAQCFPGVEVRPSPLLRECVPSVPPPIRDYLERRVSARELVSGPPQARAAWDAYFQPPEGDADEEQIIVSSGNLISYLVGRAFGAPADAWIHTDIQHCGLTEIVVSQSRGAVVMRHNDIGHLPPELRTFV
jgi:broad specificity phosphatase PhoE